MAGLRGSVHHVTLVMASRDARRDVLYETSCLSCKEASDRAKQLGTENTENKAVYSIYVGETALTARERMVGVKGEGA